MREGLVHGTSTKDGGYADLSPVTPDDLAATIFHCLGIDHKQTMYDLGGRPIPLSHGEPVREVM